MTEEIKILLKDRVNELKRLSKSSIKKALEENGILPTNELIDFEHNFGGLKLDLHNHEFQFGLIWGGGFPFNPELATVEYGGLTSYQGTPSEI
ncbi:MAG: hypothetical protein ACPGSD_08530 [Flavobacteriales bacterium]